MSIRLGSFGGVLLTIGMAGWASAPAQEAKPAPAGVDQARVDEAIEKGIAFLKAGDSPAISAGNANFANCDELILLTFLHGGVKPSDPRFQELFRRMWEAKMERTYKVVLQAMVLEELNRVKYQARIAQCAQFLVDNQCQNGQWSYGTPTPAVAPPDPVPTEFVKKDVATGAKEKSKPIGAAAEPKKPKVVRFIQIRKSRDGIAAGDNSNSQYAALGLRACHDAGIVFSADVIFGAKQWWLGSVLSSPLPDGANAGKGAVASGPGEVVRPTALWGWCYRGSHLNRCKTPDQPYESMTAGAIGALILYDSILKTSWKTDSAVQNGLAWMAAHFDATKNPGWEVHPWPAYNLYAIERLGIFAGTETFGAHRWYAEGAQFLLGAQKPDGSWVLSTEVTTPPYDTCFAILFLKRATRPINDVASVDKILSK